MCAFCGGGFCGLSAMSKRSSASLSVGQPERNVPIGSKRKSYDEELSHVMRLVNAAMRGFGLTPDVILNLQRQSDVFVQHDGTGERR